MTENDTVNQDLPDDELSSIPSITPERDDIVGRQGRRSVIARTARASSTNNRFENLRLGTDYQLWVTGVWLLSLLVAFGSIIYLYRRLEQTQQNLVAATTRVEQLETRLVTTDTSLTKSEVLLAAKLKSMDALIDNNKSELHKLSVASEKNTRTIQLQGTDLQQQKLQLEGVTDQARQTAAQVASDNVLLKSVDNTVKEAAQRMEIVQENLNDLSADTKSLTEKQQRLENDMTKRVGVLEDTAKSTDVFRRNTLDDLRKFREELSRQQMQSTSGSKPIP